MKPSIRLRLPRVFGYRLEWLGHFSRVLQDLNASKHEMAVIDRVALIMATTLNIEEVYPRFAAEMKKLVNFDRVTINTVDRHTKYFGVKYSAGLECPDPGFPEGEPLEGTKSEYVLATGKPLIVPNTAADARFLEANKRFLPMGLKSSIMVPLIHQGRILGTMCLRSRRLGAFTSREQCVLERLASQIAPAIENAILYEQTVKATEEHRHLALESKALAELGRIIGSSLHIEDVYPEFSQKVSELMPVDNINIVTIDRERNSFTVAYQSGLVVLGRERGEVVQLAGTMTEEVTLARSGSLFQTGERSQVEWLHPGLLPAFDSGIRSFLSVPLMSRDQVTGVFHLRSTLPNAYTERHLALAESIGFQIAPALDNARLYQETRKAEEAERQRSEELSVLLEVDNILSESGNFENKVWRVMNELGRIAEADTATFRVPVDGGLLLVGESGTDLGHATIVPYEGNIPAQVFEKREFMIIDNYLGHPIATKTSTARGVKSMLAAPVISQGLVLGVVIVSSLMPNHFTKERVDLLKGIINGLGSLLEKVKLEEEQKRTEERIQETARLTAIGELAAGVAHEINNPLTSVLGYSELVLRDHLPEKHRRDIQVIYEEAERAAKIVQNLLFFARRSGTEKQHLDMNSIVERALEMKSYDFKTNNIRVATRLSPELRKTMVDEHQLIQVMLNILNNAEQAIRRAQETGIIEISTTSVGNKIEISIKDDGPGVPTEHLSRIFEPFFTTKEVGQGIGLGLSVTYGLIQRHGGDIWVESTENEGATFHISLPVVLPEAIALEQSPPTAVINKSTKHLLVVDDEPHIRDLLRKYLERERYTVDMAEDGHEAWRKLQIIDYDCILLDLKMPGMSGRRLYELIQESGGRLANKVVFITGDTIGSATQDFVSQIGNPVITKPFRLEELLSTVYRVWGEAEIYHGGPHGATVA